MLGFGAVVMMFGLALIAPPLVRPLSASIGKPLERWQGLTGQLARENAQRQPQRTAVTASALMIGVALVVFVTIFAAGLRATIDQGIDEQVAPPASSPTRTASRRCRTASSRRSRKVDGVAAVSPIRFETGKLEEQRQETCR